jgi:uncharacterized protein (DUF2252 family)
MKTVIDETLPGPFEWDVKRLAASLAVAGRDKGFSAKVRHKIVLAAARSYSTAMRQFAEQPLLAVWYAHLDIEQALGQSGHRSRRADSRPPPECWPRLTPATARRRSAS